VSLISRIVAARVASRLVRTVASTSVAAECSQRSISKAP
jgi:hypothetical protein